MSENHSAPEAIADKLEALADLLEIADKNEFKIRAYRRAAETMRQLPESLDRLIAGERLQELDGIGEALAEKIEQAYRSGTIEKFKEIGEKYPSSLLEILEIKGLGPRSVRKLFDQLDVRDMEDLRKALAEDQVVSLEGFGNKTVENISEALAHWDEYSDRFLLGEARAAGRVLREYLVDLEEIGRVEIAGSCRRGCETVGDLDLLIEKQGELRFEPERLPGVESVMASGETKVTVRLETGLQADLRLVAPGEFGAAWLYFTGSKQHNIRLRERAQQKDQLINEYGLFEQETGEKICGATEAEIYEALGLEWIPPELREDSGELAAAETELPPLVEKHHLAGDGHLHTVASDGQATIEEMVEAARARDYRFLIISEHSRSLSVAGGLSNEQLHEHIEQIREIDAGTDDLKLFAGSEVDILKQGGLDYPDELLAKLDVVIAAVHSNFELSEQKQTERIVRALHHPEVDVLAHPTGRLLTERRPYDVDREEVLEAAVASDVVVEINANDRRLDANGQWCRRGKELGVEFIISTDSHSVQQLDLIELGLLTARRGWLEPAQIINHRGWKRWT